MHVFEGRHLHVVVGSQMCYDLCSSTRGQSALNANLGCVYNSFLERQGNHLPNKAQTSGRTFYLLHIRGANSMRVYV